MVFARRHVTRLVPGLAFILALLFATGTARADDEARARELYAKAAEQQKDGDFKAAAKNYLRAYKIVPRPLFLFNIAQAFRLAGDADRAIKFYDKYLELEPDGKGADLARKFRDELAEEQSGGNVDEALFGGKEPDDPGETGEETGGSDRGGKGTTGVETSEDRPGRALMWTGIAISGAGVVLLGLGANFGLEASSISDEISNHSGQWTPELLAKQSKGESANDKMILFTTIGSVAVIGGGVAAYLGLRSGDSSEERLTVAPTFGSGDVGFAVSGRF